MQTNKRSCRQGESDGSGGSPVDRESIFLLFCVPFIFCIFVHLGVAFDFLTINSILKNKQPYCATLHIVGKQ